MSEGIDGESAGAGGLNAKAETFQAQAEERNSSANGNSQGRRVNASADRGAWKVGVTG